MKIKAFFLLFLAVEFAAAQDATPEIVQNILNARCTYCHHVMKPDPNFPDDPLSGGEGWSNTYSDSTDIDNGLALSLWDPNTFQPIEGESEQTSYARLVNAPTFQMPTTVPTLRVDPGNVDNSYLYQKIASDTPKDHDPMPPGAALDSADICIIRTWIESGANPAASDGGTDYASACGVNSIRMRHIKYNGKDALPKTNWPYVIHESDNFYDLRGRHLQIEIEKK